MLEDYVTRKSLSKLGITQPLNELTCLEAEYLSTIDNEITKLEAEQMKKVTKAARRRK